MKQLLYIIGQPGAGKTTAIEKAIEEVQYKTLKFGNMGYEYYGGDCCQLGYRREMFGGTDVLPLNVQPTAIEWLTTNTMRFVLAEGDRLANDKFFQTARALGYHLVVAWVDTSDVVVSARRYGRNAPQNESWIKGRVTKVKRLARNYNAIRINGDNSVEEVAQSLGKFDVIRAIQRQR